MRGKKEFLPDGWIRNASAIRKDIYRADRILKKDIAVKVQDVAFIGGGIHVGGQKDPCQGIDDPFDLFSTDLTLQDISIFGAAIVFEGGSLTIKDIAVNNDMDESRGLPCGRPHGQG